MYTCGFVVPADLVPDRRRIVANNYVRYENVTKTDAQVLQCNASNKHGYVFANAYLNVLGQYLLQSSHFVFCACHIQCVWTEMFHCHKLVRTLLREA